MERRYIIMLISFFLTFIFFILAIWAFTEYIGDGSWNERIFIGSWAGVALSIVTFLGSAIYTIVKGLRKQAPHPNSPKTKQVIFPTPRLIRTL